LSRHSADMCVCGTIEMEEGVMAGLSIDFGLLLKEIPRGAWVAISRDQTRVLNFGADVRDVLDEARKAGEDDPIIVRIPESDSALML